MIIGKDENDIWLYRRFGLILARVEKKYKALYDSQCNTSKETPIELNDPIHVFSSGYSQQN